MTTITIPRSGPKMICRPCPPRYPGCAPPSFSGQAAEGREMAPLLECVVNVSEGRDATTLERLAQARGPYLLDVHSDPRPPPLGAHPGRARAAAPGRRSESLAHQTVTSIDLRQHQGVHPRIGALDVVPWVSLAGWPVADGPVAPPSQARDDFAGWAGTDLGLPCFLTAPSGRFRTSAARPGAPCARIPGPPAPTPPPAPPPWAPGPSWSPTTCGWPSPIWRRPGPSPPPSADPQVRALALAVGAACSGVVQPHRPVVGGSGEPSSMRWPVGPSVARAELVGLIPAAVLRAIPRHRWRELDLDPSATIEARLEQAGLDGGRFA